MRGSANLRTYGAAPHPALRATFSPLNGEKEEVATYFAAQSFSRVVDIAALAEKP